MPVQIRIRDAPSRSIALVSDDKYALIFKCTSASSSNGYNGFDPVEGSATPRYQVEFSTRPDVDLDGYRAHGFTKYVYGTLGLITIDKDVFLCVVSAAQERVATVRPGETVQKIQSVEFHCLNSTEYDYFLSEQVNSHPSEYQDSDGYDLGYGQVRPEGHGQHPCLRLKNLLSGGTFYYSADFDLTRRLQKRISDDENTIALDSLDAGFLWNSFMIQPLVDFRSRLGTQERAALDASRLLTSAIRGFCQTFVLDASRSPLLSKDGPSASYFTLISRLSSRRAGTRFNARGIDDDGNVANFVETETSLCDGSGVVFSYVQIRGSIPLFWEQATGLLPNQQKITITRSPEATQPAFDKHFEHMHHSYGGVHIVNLLSKEKLGEIELSDRYHYHIKHSSLNSEREAGSDYDLLKETQYDFHAETRATGYAAAERISYQIQDSTEGFAYFLAEEIHEKSRSSVVPILQQEGVFRTNCLDCLDRTNLVQTIISKLAMESFLDHRGVRATTGLWTIHSTLWADNGDNLSRIYAGTGALKSSFTRNGKMSLGGMLSDARKSAQRLYHNNVTDKPLQVDIDTLLGRQIGQIPVHLYDPVNDHIQSQLKDREDDYTSTRTIRIQVGTFNLNGKTKGIREDLTPWLCPPVNSAQKSPEIVAIGFQEIVELSPQQIMSTDPERRQHWEAAVRRCLNENAEAEGTEEYVLLRGGQLVGASLSVFVKTSALPYIKNVEGTVRKTGLSGMAGNKGAVAIRMDFSNTSICLVTAHLAAGFANYEQRNADYRTIADGLRFQRNRTIDDHDTVIWLGDFNYRIGLDNDRVRDLLDAGDLPGLYEHDQLKLQMGRGYAFPYYDEAKITFDPTYKYDLGTDRYDSSEKQRIPAWTDRVLRKGHNLKQIDYNTAPLRFSDHRPVYATFLCEVSTVDEKRKEKLSSQLYKARKAEVVAGNLLDDEDDKLDKAEEQYQNDKRWWLNNGMSARANVQPPDNQHVLNPQRPHNPFAKRDSDDWIRVDRPVSISSASQIARSATTGLSQAPSRTQSNASIRRKVPPPFGADASTPQLPPRRSTLPIEEPLAAVPSARAQLHKEQPEIAPALPSRTSTNSSLQSNMTSPNVLRKPAPPRVPKKPVALTSTPSNSSVARLSSASDTPARTVEPIRAQPDGVESDSSYRSSINGRPISLASKPSTPPSLPPPRRSIAANRGNVPASPTASRSGTPSRGPAPAPPPRTVASAALMDDNGDADALSGWEVLKPA